MRGVYKAIFRRVDGTLRIVYFTAPREEELLLMAQAALLNKYPTMLAKDRGVVVELYQVDQVEA